MDVWFYTVNDSISQLLLYQKSQSITMGMSHVYLFQIKKATTFHIVA